MCCSCFWVVVLPSLLSRVLPLLLDHLLPSLLRLALPSLLDDREQVMCLLLDDRELPLLPSLRGIFKLIAQWCKGTVRWCDDCDGVMTMK